MPLDTIKLQKQERDSMLSQVYIERKGVKEALKILDSNLIKVIIGPRRAGKSVFGLLLLKGKNFAYLNFDDENLLKIKNYDDLISWLNIVYPNFEYIFFDEIQNIRGWELFVNRILRHGYRVFITGSNANLLSKELGTHLTGRYLMLQMFPFSFKEFLLLKKFELNKNSAYLTISRAKIKKYFSDYFINGGFPEYLKELNPDYIKTLYENIIYRDILVRYKIPNEKSLKELVHLAMNNISKEISFNSIKKTLVLGSSTTVKDYFDYLENSFLIFLVPKFDYSLRKQMYYNKKVYCIDNGLAKYLGFRVTPDNGKLLENIVFIELKIRGKEIYYYSDKKECDFVVKEGRNITKVIQVCYELTRDNKEREIEGLTEAMNKFKLKEGLILTYDQEEEIKIKGNSRIIIKPVWKWLLEKNE